MVHLFLPVSTFFVLTWSTLIFIFTHKMKILCWHIDFVKLMVIGKKIQDKYVVNYFEILPVVLVNIDGY